MIRRFCGLFIVWSILLVSSHAAVIDGYQMAINDRFAQSDAFIGGVHDWSGVGMNTAGRWATLIGPNTVISAGHFAPSGRVNFFPSNIPSVSAVRRDIVEGQRIDGTDLWLGCLDEAVPDGIAVYDYVTDDITPTNFSSWDMASATVFMVGRSPGSYPTVQDQAIGRNMIVGFGNNDAHNSGLGDNVDTLSLAFESRADPNYVVFESVVEVGDSGAPLLTNVDGNLVLLGVNSFLTTSANLSTSHVSYIGNESDQVGSYVTHCLQQIPEPGSAALACLACFILFTTSRRIKHSAS